MKELIIAIGLLLFIEGMLYALFPSKMKNMLLRLNEINNIKDLYNLATQEKDEEIIEDCGRRGRCQPRWRGHSG